ncbi:hypothetical protein E4T56_gene4571, partial [Termitomyces sp. T112]
SGPRATGNGMYKDKARNVPILSIRMGDDLPATDQPRFEYLSSAGASFRDYRRHLQHPDSRPPPKEFRAISGSRTGVNPIMALDHSGKQAASQGGLKPMARNTPAQGEGRDRRDTRGDSTDELYRRQAAAVWRHWRSFAAYAAALALCAACRRSGAGEAEHHRHGAL